MKSIVLLENRGALPLGPAVKRLAIVGPTADDLQALLGNYAGTPSAPVTLLAGLRAAARARGIAVRYARGATLAGSGSSLAQVADAVTAARRSDAVVAVLGLDPRLEAEEGDSVLNPAGDRRDLGLPGAQAAAAGGAGRDRQAGHRRADRGQRAGRSVRLGTRRGAAGRLVPGAGGR